MIKSSLFFDGLLVTYSLWKNKAFPAVDPEELSQSIRSTIAHYGAYSALIGLWRPEDDDERQLIRNIKILAANFRAQTEPPRLYKLEGLEKMAAN